MKHFAYPSIWVAFLAFIAFMVWLTSSWAWGWFIVFPCLVNYKECDCGKEKHSKESED